MRICIFLWVGSLTALHAQPVCIPSGDLRVIVQRTPTPPLHIRRIHPQYAHQAEVDEMNSQRITIRTEFDHDYLPPGILYLPECINRLDDAASLKTLTCDIRCGVPCRVTLDAKYRGPVHAHLILHLWAESTMRAKRGTLLALAQTEINSKPTHLASLLQKFDIVLHPHRTAHVMTPAHNNAFFRSGIRAYTHKGLQGMNLEDEMRHLTCVWQNVTREPEPISFIASNCGNNNRTRFVKELMQHIPVASYGPCLNNRAYPRATGAMTKYAKKRSVEMRHKFCLVVESDQGSDDWVTERIYHALEAGCVPVYHGSVHLSDYVPCSSPCYIDVRDFQNVGALATRLRYLYEHASEYARYLRYKRQAFYLTHEMQMSKRYMTCGLCKVISARMRYPLNWTRILRYDRFTKQFVHAPLKVVRLQAA